MSGSSKDSEELRAWRQRICGLVWIALLLLLMQPGPVLGQTDEEIEQVFWGSVECKSARQVQAYFEVYPTGRYVAEAHACLEGQLGLDRAARRLVQQGLTALGYAVGAADGLFGPATRKALREWQAGKGFTATGYLTREQADTLTAQGRERARKVSSPRISPDQTCAGKPKGAECWMELANQAGCYVWNPGLVPDASVTWIGKCSSGLAHGKGTLTWVWDGNKSVATRTGLLRSGKPHGDWVLREANGAVNEGPYVDGKRYGHWVERFTNGTVWEGPYVDGKSHGHWVARYENGTVAEGPFVDGRRRGHWVIREADGDIGEGLYVDGERHGRWVWRFADGNIREGPYVDGKQHGRWVERRENGDVVWEVTYVNGERQ